MSLRRCAGSLLLLSALGGLSTGVCAGDDDYTAMLHYLSRGSLQGHLLRAGAHAPVSSSQTGTTLGAQLDAVAVALPGLGAHDWVGGRVPTELPRAAQARSAIRPGVTGQDIRSWSIDAGQELGSMLALGQAAESGRRANVLSLSVSELPR